MATPVKTIADLKKEAIEKDAKITELEEQVADQQKKIKVLKGVVENKKEVKQEAAKPVIPEPVDIDGKTVKFKVMAFWFKGERYTAEDAATDKELMKNILAVKGQGILHELV
jgi:hypothetical protein